MGFLDNAKNKLSAVSDANSDAENKTSKNSFISGLSNKIKVPSISNNKNNKEEENYYDDEEEFYEEEPEEDGEDNFSSVDSVFDIDDEDDFFEQKQKEYDNAMKRYDDVPDLGLNKRIEDVLEVLEIPSTFEIESDIFIPEDLEDIIFDKQTPVGYEMGQVDYFVTQSKNTVEKYYSLLKLRNEHVAKMASVVDKLQVSINNLKFQQEINAGINIMATNDDEDLETKYEEAVLHIKRLEDEIKRNSGKTNLSKQQKDNYQEKINSLRDQLSVIQRENNDLKEENYSLKNQIAQAIELEDDFAVRDDEVDYSDSDDSLDSIMLAPELGSEYIDQLPEVTDFMNDDSYLELGLPNLEEESIELPNIDLPEISSTLKPKKVQNSVFDVDEDQDPFTVSTEKESASFIKPVKSFEEEDDLDKLMQDWNE